ncbi:Transcription elongation factor, GreA/GreB, C-term [Reichenbachiella faecimaris]|uniref:Transcription elongation factor, GreA/GreB, C-term n=1 Tax=Reichenbachiella faecimaris TaxID=692418 RepID=A0A1W2GD95_REIFA|nr:GreA/GreB family elongation factor [Reichenbachiella faecimaris]SMD34442.1 Transcription elongation factor, GreA/GreB, C-term [Reichenbachiella faecimaris]
MIAKSKVHSACLELLEKKIGIAKQGMEEAQASANNETKSSAGDKYETGRAMSQRERDLHARQLSELMNMKKTLNTIASTKTMNTVELGALVETNTLSYYISAGLGVINFEKQQIMAISAISPIAQAMLGKKVGDTFEWMKKENMILSVS